MWKEESRGVLVDDAGGCLRMLEMVMVLPFVVDSAPAFSNARRTSLGSAERGTPPRTRQVVARDS